MINDLALFMKATLLRTRIFEFAKKHVFNRVSMRFFNGRFRNSEIDDFNHLLVLFIGYDQKIVRRNVSVNHAFLMGKLKPQRRLTHDADRFVHRNLPIAIDPFQNTFAFYQFQNHEKSVFLFERAELVELNQVGMAEFGKKLRFANKAIHEGGLFGESGADEFDCALFVQIHVSRFIYSPHSPPANDV